jgi:hypothetical protein
MSKNIYSNLFIVNISDSSLKSSVSKFIISIGTDEDVAEEEDVEEKEEKEEEGISMHSKFILQYGHLKSVVGSSFLFIDITHSKQIFFLQHNNLADILCKSLQNILF